MIDRRLLTVLTLVACLAVVFALAGGTDAASRRGKVYVVTVTNLTRGQVLSPPVVATHNEALTPLWTLGEAVSAEVAAVAEDAANDDLVALLDASGDVQEVAVMDGPIPPGESRSIEIEVGGKCRLVSLISMLVQTNDAFVGLRGVEVPRKKSDTGAHLSPAYDAGSEENNESGDFIPGPPFGSGNVRATEGAEGFAHVHAGVHGIADLDPETYDWRNPAARITIRRK
jgi:hypothetical protein